MAKQSDFYWRERENEWIREQMKLDRNREKEINKRLSRAIDDINKEIAKNYANYAKSEGIDMSEMMKRADKVDVEKFAKKAKEYVKNKDFSTRANYELKLYNLKMRISRLELLKAEIGLELIQTFDGLDKYTYSEVFQAALDEYKRQSGILGDSVGQDYKSKVEKIMDGSFRSREYATFSDNIWQSFTEMKLELEKLLTRSITMGRNPKTLASELEKFLKPGQDNVRYKMNRLMITEVSKIQSDVSKASYKENDIKQYIYIAEPTACDACAFLDGKVMEVKNIEVGKNYFPMHPNCRCAASSYFDRTELDKELNEIAKQKE